MAANPRDAAACYCLGMIIARPGDDRALREALRWLAMAVALAPENEDYLADYGGTSLELAEKARSIEFALKGRNAMEKALTMDPRDFAAREGLMRFYAQAPWPLGSATKARAQAAAIVSGDKNRGLKDLLLLGRIQETGHDASAAREAYTAALAIDPRNAVALRALARMR